MSEEYKLFLNQSIQGVYLYMQVFGSHLKLMPKKCKHMGCDLDVDDVMLTTRQIQRLKTVDTDFSHLNMKLHIL